MNIIKPADFKTEYFTETDLAVFYLVMHDFAKNFGCFYISYMFEDLSKETRFGFTSNPVWQDNYVGKHLADTCHLVKNVKEQFDYTKKSFLILPWDTVKPMTSLEKDIVLFRGEMGIGQNGISFCSQESNFREFFAIAPEKNTPHFMRYVSKNIGLVKSHIHLFRRAAKDSIK